MGRRAEEATKMDMESKRMRRDGLRCGEVKANCGVSWVVKEWDSGALVWRMRAGCSATEAKRSDGVQGACRTCLSVYSNGGRERERKRWRKVFVRAG